MKSFAVTVVALAAFVTPSLGAQFKISRKGNEPEVVPNKVIVELDSTSVLTTRGEPVDVHARFFEELDRRLPANAVKTKKKYESDVFNGAAIEITNVDDLKTITSMQGVKAVRPVLLVKGPHLNFQKPGKPAKAPGQYPPNIMTGVDKVQAKGNRGKGIKIGIIDSGVDYNHPALGGGFGPKFKIAGGYDFVGDDYRPDGTGAVPDADPMDSCNGHGTHVAGIIGANPDNQFNVTGVAYEATLRAYRIFGCAMYTDEAIIVDALVRAYKDGNDVITLSVGLSGGWSSSTSAVVASRIVSRGRVVTAAAGNSGDLGAWSAESPSAGKDVISVASVENIATGPLFEVATTLPDLPRFPYHWVGTLASIPVGDLALPIYATSNDSTVVDDACNELPDSTPDLSGYVTLVRRGTCGFMTKIQNVLAKNGSTIIVYNNGGTFASPDFAGYEQAVLVQDADGQALLDAYLAGKKFTVSFPQDHSTNVPNTRTGGLISETSSYGPTWEIGFKPSLAAPGGGIVSTWPISMGSFMLSSGTSMSTPHVAGIAALILKAKGRGAAKDIRALLQTTSTTVPATLIEGSEPQTLAQAGAGMANAYNALNYQTIVTPSELLLNDTAHWRSSHTIYIRNTGRKTKTYKLKHIAAGTALSLIEGTFQPAAGPLSLDSTAASVRLSTSRLTLGPGRSGSVFVIITAPKDAKTATLPIVSGHIEVATSGETLHVSYLGVASDLTKAQVIDTSPEVVGVPFPFLIDGTGNVQADPMTYSWVGEDYPVISWRNVLGSARLTIDLVAPNTKAPVGTNLNALANPAQKRALKKGWLGGIIGGWLHGRPGRGGGSYARVPIVGQLASFDMLRRQNLIDDPYIQYGISNVFLNGTAVAPGTYKVMLRSLKIGGDPLRQEHYETWLSPDITIPGAATTTTASTSASTTTGLSTTSTSTSAAAKKTN
ncbi:subtilisin-like protein [Auriculariales sp. MPI-PUGE-AT-0066]|nr:subtilisin-like protein [Auriculariales sp. MPI-PUGE-AT-0066]